MSRKGSDETQNLLALLQEFAKVQPSDGHEGLVDALRANAHEYLKRLGYNPHDVPSYAEMLVLVQLRDRIRQATDIWDQGGDSVVKY